MSNFLGNKRSNDHVELINCMLLNLPELRSAFNMIFGNSRGEHIEHKEVGFCGGEGVKMVSLRFLTVSMKFGENIPISANTHCFLDDKIENFSKI